MNLLWIRHRKKLFQVASEHNKLHILSGPYSKDKKTYKKIQNFFKFVVGSGIDVVILKVFCL